MPFDFIIVLAEDVWDELSSYQRRALVDHELCHCMVTEKEEQRLVPHDIEMFRKNFERFGFWWPLAEQTEQAFQQRFNLEGVARPNGPTEALEPDVLAQVGNLFDPEDGQEEEGQDG
jgi:hypothetical protein